MPTHPARTLAALAATALLITGCAATPAAPKDASASSITVEHARGTLQLPAVPQRIVALDLGAYDTLRSVGLADKVVGLPKAGPMQPEITDSSSDKATDIGTMFEPNLEAINRLRPDLVIVGFRSAKHYPELSRHFPTIDVTYAHDKPFVDGVSYAARIIGTATGTTTRVDEKLAALTAAIAKAKPATPETAMVLMTTAGKVTAHGSVSRYGAIYRDLGYTPAMDALKDAPHGDPISFEAISQANPARLFVLDRDAAVGQSGAAARQVLDNELVARTDAWTNNRVVYLNGARWYVIIHGLDNAIAMVDEVAA